MNPSVPVPERMRTVIIDAYGPPDVLRSVITPTPNSGRREVLVRTHLAGINFIDAKTRAGNGIRVPSFPVA
jgi:NADPH2:quinone reductase